MTINVGQGEPGEVWHVLSASTAAPPGSPQEEDAYIVPVGGTDAWIGADGYIAVYSSARREWLFIPPGNGWLAYAFDVDDYYRFNAGDVVWSIDTAGGGGGGGGAVTSVAGRTGAVVLAAGDIASGILADARMPDLTGDVTSSDGAVATTIAAAAVTLAKMANLAPNSLIGNNTGGATTPLALTVAQIKTLLAYAVGDVTGAAPLASPALSGNPTVPTQSSSDNSTKAASTAFVASAIAAIIGGLAYKGTWNANTNTPAITSGSGTLGWFYKVATAGATAIDGNSQWNVGDVLLYDGSAWDKIDGIPSEVTSVSGRVGAVTLASGDVSGLSASATTDATNASNISSGSLALARIATIATLTILGNNTGGASVPIALTVAQIKTLLAYAVADVSGAAPLASPALSGTPTAPTASALDNTTKVATTAYVDGAVGVGARPRFSASVSASPGTTVNDYNAAGAFSHTTTRFLVTAAAGDTTITGFDATGFNDGDSFLLRNPSTTDNLILSHQSGSSLSGNRLECTAGQPFELPPRAAKLIAREVNQWVPV